MKPLLILFEGVDKSGKTTLLANFNKLTNFKYWVLDRSFISSLVYNELFKRKDQEYYLKILEAAKESFNIIIIYTYANTEIISKRLNLYEEKLPSELKDIDKVKLTYLKYIKQSKLNFLKLDTSHISIEEGIVKIKEFVKKNKKRRRLRR